MLLYVLNCTSVLQVYLLIGSSIVSRVARQRKASAFSHDESNTKIPAHASHCYKRANVLHPWLLVSGINFILYTHAIRHLLRWQPQRNPCTKISQSRSSKQMWPISSHEVHVHVHKSTAVGQSSHTAPQPRKMAHTTEYPRSERANKRTSEEPTPTP